MNRSQCLSAIQNCIWDSNGAFVPAQKNIEAAIDAYTDAQVAAKDAEIEGLKANLQGQVDARMRDRKSKKELSDMYIALKADKERTREGVDTQVERLHKLHNNSSTLSDDDCEWLRSIAKELKPLLSPADGDALHQSNTDLAAMLKEQVEENARLVDKLKRATCFEINDRISIDSRGNNTWAIVRDESSVMSKKLKDFVREPMPSSRTNAFIKDTRFASVDDAIAFWSANYPIAANQKGVQNG